MNVSAATRVLWKGENSVQAARRAIEEGANVELVLPAEFHHALFANLSRANPARVERIDLSGGPELLREAAQVRGLGDLAELIDAAQRARSQVRLLSPSPRILIGVPQHA